MLNLIYFIIGILLVLSIFLNIQTKRAPNIFRFLIAISILFLTIYLVKGIFIDYILFLDNYQNSKLLPYILSFGIMVVAYLILSLNIYFERFFSKVVDIKTEFIAVLVFGIGILSFFLNEYDLFFYALIILGFELLLLKILIKSTSTKKFFWLTILYILPVLFLIIFVISQANLFILISSYTLIKIQLLTVSLEYLLIALIMSFLLLIVYYLPYEKIKLKLPKVKFR